MFDSKKEDGPEQDKFVNETEVAGDHNQTRRTDEEEFGEQFGNDYGYGREREK